LQFGIILDVDAEHYVDGRGFLWLKEKKRGEKKREKEKKKEERRKNSKR